MTTTAFEAPPVAEQEKDNKKVVVAAGVVGALLLGFAGYHFLLAGGNAQEDTFVVPSTRKAAPKAVAPGAKPAAKPAAKGVVPAATSIKLGRDPFLALYTVPVAQPAAPVAPAAPGTNPDDDTTTPTTTPYALALTSITGSGADAKVYAFKVDGQPKSVIAAQKFGKYGELVTLAYVKDSKGKVIGALIQVGDDDPTAIKIGEKITVL